MAIENRTLIPTPHMKYTQKELDSLYHILVSTQKVGSITHVKFYYPVGILEDLEPTAHKTLSLPLHHMPLLINHPHHEIKSIAIWRLQIGK